MKKLPIGVNDFKELIEEGYYFVDKTMLIKDVIELPGKIKLITRPRRFGKTLNMSMMEHFFSLFREGKLFEDLTIWNEKGIVKDYYHEYPVVFVTFKEMKDVKWQEAKRSVKARLSELVKEYRPFLEGKLKDPGDARELEGYALGEKDPEEYKWVLEKLTRWLHQVYGKKTILLIDEYDVPIEAAYTYRHRDPDYYENMVAFMRNMLTAALKDNEHLEFGILTGVYRVAKESIFSGLNNLAVYTVFENGMVDRFGFTGEEVKEMLKHYGVDTEEDIQTVKEWYDGFKVGEYEFLYNPWSVIYYIAERLSGRSFQASAQPFWINTSSNDLIKHQIETNEDLKEELEALLQGREIVKRIDPWLSLREMEGKEEGVWTLLVSSGYLTVRYIGGIGFGKYSLRIPNEEVLYFYKDSIMDWIGKKAKVKMRSMMDDLAFLLEEGRYKRFRERLKSFIESSMSYYDFGPEPERVYKAFLLGMLAIAVNGYVVESEKESGLGRLDLVIYPKEKRYGKYAVIFEVKRADKEEKLEELAKAALDQIRDRGYYKKMEELEYGVIGFGIAFSLKKVEIEVGELR